MTGAVLLATGVLLAAGGLAALDYSRRVAPPILLSGLICLLFGGIIVL